MTAPDRPATSAEDALALAQRAGIHRIALPTPFLVGRVNCYLIEDEPLTLIDTGPNSGKTLDDLERALAAHNRRIEDLELIVLTHQHMDHLGLLEILARRSGAEVAALDLLAPYLADFSRSATADDEFAQAIMRRHGVPDDLATVLGSLAAAFRAFGSSGRVTRPLHDGGTLQLRDRTLRIFRRPGHSPSDTIFWDEDRAMVIAGDHLLARISSNPLVSRPLSGPQQPRPRALLQYMDSLRATRELPARLILPGHGEPILEHAELIDERLRMHRRRAARVLQILDGHPLSAYEIALQMWGNVAVTQAYLTLSEVLGHLDLLVDMGQAAEREADGASVFEAV
ncbi:MAG: MBL fold metallo-hydrolase [Solirubrobacterales bacterium]|nr:MBL fold metallo-hydrolase [Solirubrobacterales bacterium]MBV9682686.1 MBL fold metallo-hydrolase [Solirubrobacterales bacterium]MBV9810830.1 MBL fold metallo-hydrolase [Solirubrobacterales bacterium]